MKGGRRGCDAAGTGRSHPGAENPAGGGLPEVDPAALTDEALAEVIEADGRWRVEQSQPVTLDRYLQWVPDLACRADALDAAIDVGLRASVNAGADHEEALAMMVQQHPALARTIREAAALNRAMLSTRAVRQRIEASTSPAPRALPQDFGPLMADGRARYELCERIGGGAFGQVYRAVDRHLSEEGHTARVAVKVLTKGSLDARQECAARTEGREPTADSRRRLADEATRARRVDHPNVVRVLDRGLSDDDEDYVVYELIEGGDLSSRRRLPLPEAARLCAQIARGVQAAHSAGLVHCDLKPGNIILTADGQPKVCDFGIARARESDGARLSALGSRQGAAVPAESPDTDSGEPIPGGNTRSQSNAAGGPVPQPRLLGSLAYISPEQYRMEPGALNTPSDIYSIGGILFTLLTGRLPNGSSVEEIAAIHDPHAGRTEPPLLRPLRPEIDRDLEAICRRALAPNPVYRYSAAGALADDLEAWLRHEPLYWAKPSALRILRLWVRRKPAVAAIAAAACILLVGGALTAHHFRQQTVVALAQSEAERARAAEADLIAAEERARAAEAHAAAEIDRIRAEEEALRNEQIRQYLRGLRGRMEEIIEQGRASTQMLSFIWALEYLFGPEVIGGPQDSAEVRFAAVQSLVEQARAAGRERDLEGMLWQTTLAFWLVARNEMDQADPLLAELEVHWGERLAEGDPWLGYLSAIRACSNVRRIVGEQPVGGTRGPGDEGAARSETLRASKRIIIEQERAVAEHSPGSALHRLMLETLAEAYASPWLDDAAALQEIEKKLAERHGPLSR